MRKDKRTELWRVVKFVLFSASAGVIQIGLFTALNELCRWSYWPCYLIALVASVVWNFTLNRKFTFQSANNVPKAMAMVLGYYAVFFTGYHAWAGCPGNPLSHTMNGRNNHVFLNGTLCSEFLINSYTAGYYGVPVALLTGDKALCDFAKTLIPAITTVPVNEGRGGSVTSLHPDEAVERIEAAAKEAVAKAAQCVVPMPEHFHMEIDFVKHHVAYSKSFYPGATLKDDKFVCFDSDDWYEVLRFCHFVLSDG